MKGVPYYKAGKGDTPRSCNSKAYLENYERIFRNARRLKKPDEKCPTAKKARRKMPDGTGMRREMSMQVKVSDCA
jgi:hypothetical protein